ncbi:MAG: 2-phospho-L-lactate transferase [Pseudomonadaceae bacterium]|nr:2-phospho-L-lactate transferase [Pseudomonadaceae bacterium]
MSRDLKILALTGGVGGAKLAFGLSKLLPPEQLAFIANTGDDFEHFGLTICPDLDTLTYTLAETANPETGWGRQDETWNFMAAMEQLGGETWFSLGDRDLALHHQRSQMLAEGSALSEVTDTVRRAFDIKHAIWPMSDSPVRTIVATPEEELAFQHYFVRDRCKPAVTGFRFDGIDRAAPIQEALNWLESVDAIVICPSNPFVSVDPMLSIPGFRDRLKARSAPVIAVSPIIGGQALKGPAAKMMKELGVPVTSTAVAAHYGDLIDGFVLDNTDAHAASEVSCATVVTNSVMVTLEDRIKLAERTLDFASELI